MQQARFRGACSLIEVTRILVQQRGKRCITEQDLGVAASKCGPQTLAVSSPTLTVARVADRLINCSVQTEPVIVTGSVRAFIAS